MKQERRSFNLTEMTLETREQDQPPKIRGYAAVFNSMSEEMWGFREIIRPGAFSKSLGNDIRALRNHDTAYVLGRTKSGTLRLVEDERGLAIEVDPPNTQWANDLMESMKRGDINQMSFGFQVKDDAWTENDDGTYTRELREINLFEVSVVTFPAYTDTSAGVRSAEEVVSERQATQSKLDELKEEKRQAEIQNLRDLLKLK